MQGMSTALPDNTVLRSKRPIPESLLRVCKEWADSRSKDPNTKVAAAVYDPVTGGMFLGYNGFPSYLPDLKRHWENRDVQDKVNNKYSRVIHAEIAALDKARMCLGENVKRCFIVSTHLPCGSCMLSIIAAGIRKVYYEDKHWNDPVTATLAEEAEVTLEQIG
jgi:deoxycytidylate deaminase